MANININWPALLKQKQSEIEREVAQAYKSACNGKTTLSVYLEKNGQVWTGEDTGNTIPMSVWEGNAIHIYSIDGYDWEDVFSPEEWFSVENLRGLVSADEALDFLKYVYTEWKDGYEPADLWSAFRNFCDADDRDDLMDRIIEFCCSELDYREWEVAEDAFQTILAEEDWRY